MGYSLYNPLGKYVSYAPPTPPKPPSTPGAPVLHNQISVATVFLLLSLQFRRELCPGLEYCTVYDGLLPLAILFQVATWLPPFSLAKRPMKKSQQEAF